MSQYLDLFVNETREHLQKMGELLASPEPVLTDRATIDALFRSAHSVKGMSASMEFHAIADLAHTLEDLMDRVRKGMPLEKTLRGLILEAVDCLERMVQGAGSGGGSDPALEGIIKRIKGFESGDVASPDVQTAAEHPAKRIDTPADRLASPQTVRVKTEILDRFINTTGELITIKHRLASIAAGIDSPMLREAVGDLHRRLRELHDQVTTVRLIPLSSITDRFPRMVRELAKKTGKEIQFSVQGAGVELDRGILEELADPLVHMLRNAVDHGIETPEVRLAAGKEAAGSVVMQVNRDKDQVEIVIVDDGRGIDPGRIIAAAVAKGIITADKGQQLSQRDAFMLVCHPGFSTAEQVTDISGRGVGMDAVLTTIQSLSGTMTIDSKVGKGSRFAVKFPLTVAIINVLLVMSGKLTLAIPVSSIQRTLELKKGLIATSGKQKVFYLDEEPVPILSLNRILGEPLLPRSGDLVPLFVCEIKGRRVGMVVDRFIGHQEVFVKPLGRPLARVRMLNGGALLGSGEIVFVLDVPNLL
jgi:two-component system chemotaxis sensor kinase CheA